MVDISKANSIKKEWSTPGKMEHELEDDLNTHLLAPCWIPTDVRERYQKAIGMIVSKSAPAGPSGSERYYKREIADYAIATDPIYKVTHGRPQWVNDRPEANAEVRYMATVEGMKKYRRYREMQDAERGIK